MKIFQVEFNAEFRYSKDKNVEIYVSMQLRHYLFQNGILPVHLRIYTGV